MPEGYSVETDPSLPLITVTLHAGFDAEKHAEDSMRDILAAFEAFDGKFYYIADLEASHWTFGELVGVLGDIAGEGGMLRHPDIIELIAVTQDAVVSMGMNALSQQQYGELTVRIVESHEQGIEYVLQQVEKSA